MSTLYELTGEYRIFQEQIPMIMDMIESGEMDAAYFQDTLESIKTPFEEKVDNLVCVIKNENADIEAMEREVANLQKRIKQKKGAVDRLKNYVSDSMLSVNQLKLETPRNRLSFRKSESVQIEDEGQFVAWAQRRGYTNFLTIKDPTVNKTEVKKAIAAGGEFPGASVVSKMNLQIK